MEALRALTLEELDHQQGELLPAREAMDSINITTVTAINLAIAVNAASPGAEATAAAVQGVETAQG